MIKQHHWDVFQYRNQERRSWIDIALEMKCEITQAKQYLAELRKLQPDLFPIETEKMRFGSYNMDRAGKKLYNVDDLHNHGEIKEKF